MDPRADRRIDADFRKGAIEGPPDWSDPAPADVPESARHAVALTEDMTHADPRDIKHAEAELGADDDGTPG
jgi:hypothetical protein